MRAGGNSRTCYFNPRSPHGERLTRLMRARWHGPFQSTLPARGATDVAKGRKRPRKDFNPRSPHGERRRTATHKRRRERFQSTLPARGATEPPARASSRQQFQSTLPARGATVAHPVTTERLIYFNPRSPHGERHPQGNLSYLMGVFQSTLPARGATFSLVVKTCVP